MLAAPFIFGSTLDNDDKIRFQTVAGEKVRQVLAENADSLSVSFAFERSLYRTLAAPLVARAALVDEQLAARQRVAGGSFQLNLLAGLLKLCQLIATGARFIVAVFAVAFTIGWVRKDGYEGNDFLGVSGNGRMFFSGVNIPFDTEKLIPNLMTLNTASSKQIRHSALMDVLRQFKATSSTAEELIGYLLHYSDTPSSITSDNDSPSAADWTQDNLVSVLKLQKSFQATYRLQITKSSDSLSHNILRALSSSQKKSLAEIPCELTALLILAIGASKILEFQVFNGQWVRQSQYPELSARAIINSTRNFTKEYYQEARTIVRQALVYSSRSTNQICNNQPVSMNQHARALRQIAELIYLSDNKRERKEQAIISSYLNEAEEVTEKWEESFLETVRHKLPREYQCILTPSKALYIPIGLAVKLFEEVLVEMESVELDELYLGAQELKASKLRTGKPVSAHWQSIPLAMEQREQIQTASNHHLSPAELRLWTTLRPILKANSWIKEFIDGEFINTSYLVTKSVSGQLLNGLIPINTDRLSQACGNEAWENYFQQVRIDSNARQHTQSYSEPQVAKRALMRRVK